MTDETESTWICHACIGDSFLNEEVRSGGKWAKCSYCGTMRESLSLEELANRIHEVLEEHFNLTTERLGEPVGYVIQEIASVDERIAEGVRKRLSDLHADDDVWRSDWEDRFGDGAFYEARGPGEWCLRESWKRFRREIQFRSRFFSPRQALDEIFRDIGTLRAWKGAPVIRETGPDDQNRYIFRARVAQSKQELWDILSVPEKRLGAPPSRTAKAGRMNAAGISVFYGARDEDTCIAEIRAPVGSYVVVGRFEIIRPVRLLDSDVLAKVFAGSYFDPEFRKQSNRAAFLRSLVHEISRPIMPRDDEFDYLPTQAVSEYLASCVEPRLDGLVFHSSQMAGEGRNIVLFNHSRHVEPYNRPESRVLFFSMGRATEDHYDDGITIFEYFGPPEKAPDPVEFASPPDAILVVRNQDNGGDDLEYQDDATLRLDVEGIRVLKIEAARYRAQDLDVRWYAPPRFEGA